MSRRRPDLQRRRLTVGEIEIKGSPPPVSSEGRPNSARRGYDAAWRRRRAEQLERQPWCEMHAETIGIELAALLTLAANATAASAPARVWLPDRGYAAIPLADTADHRKARRTFAPELQGSDAPGGSEHPDNLRSLCHSCHSRRTEDKARRAT